jgi:hypothetical protein
MFAQDEEGNWLSWASISLGYKPRDRRSLTGFRRPPRHPACVVDYFTAISRTDHAFQVEEMRLMMERPNSFFDDDDISDDDTELELS